MDQKNWLSIFMLLMLYGFTGCGTESRDFDNPVDPKNTNTDSSKSSATDGSTGGDTASGFECSEVTYIPAPQSLAVLGLAWDGSHLWTVQNVAPNVKMTFSKVDLSNGSVISSFTTDLNYTWISDLAWDGTYFYTANSYSDGTFYKIDTSGTIVHSYTETGYDHAVVYHKGSLWVGDSSSNRKITQISTTGSKISSFDDLKISIHGLASNGTYLFASSDWTEENSGESTYRLYKIDPTNGSVISHCNLDDSYFGPKSNSPPIVWIDDYIWIYQHSTKKIIKLDLGGQ